MVAPVPELAEVEAYRRLAESTALHRRVVAVDADDAWYLKGGTDPRVLEMALVGSRFVAARRIGKLLLLDTAADLDEGAGAQGPTLGLRFGMTGRLVVDGVPGVERLLYSGNGEEPAWDRFAVRFGVPSRRSGVSTGAGCTSPSVGRLVMRDPRRLGGVELAPDEARLGPDASTIGAGELRAALGSSTAPLKARLMDQARVAGVGNLTADEVLWRASLCPTRAAGGLNDAEVRRLARVLRGTIAELIERGGSHTGELSASRLAGGQCPRDATSLVRSTVGGRTTWWCPRHQR